MIKHVVVSQAFRLGLVRVGCGGFFGEPTFNIFSAGDLLVRVLLPVMEIQADIMKLFFFPITTSHNVIFDPIFLPIQKILPVIRYLSHQ